MTFVLLLWRADGARPMGPSCPQGTTLAATMLPLGPGMLVCVR